MTAAGALSFDLAIGYAAAGWPVFPCDPATKAPLTLHGFKDATLDKAAIKIWWRRWPNAMIGVPTGPLSGFWALDLDGPEALATIVALGELPETLRQRTPRGEHVLFRWVPDRPVKNTARKIGPGVDTRGSGGYVIMAGSIRDTGEAYEWVTSPDALELAEAPEWIFAALTPRPDPAPTPPAASSNIVLMDRARTSYALAALDDECRAVETAPAGTRNNQLNTSAFKLGTLIAAGALSERATYDALYAAADRCGLVHEDGAGQVRATLESGLRGGARHPREIPERVQDGSAVMLRSASSRTADGERQEWIAEEGATEELDAVPFDGELPSPRPWAFGKMLLHRTVTAVAAPAGTGKSTWTLQLAIAFAVHQQLGPFEPRRTGPAWLWNNEDDRDEMNRRTLAACQWMNIDPGQLAGRLYLNTGAERPLIVAREDKRARTLVETPDVAAVIQIIKRRGIKLLVVDPFAETFEVESENSNDMMKQVARLYRQIARDADCSVMLVVHTPKGALSGNAAGDINAIRGGGAIGGVVRGAWTMFDMTEDDANRFGVSPHSRHLYVRLDSAKANMSLRSHEPIWWRKETVLLDNATDNDPQDAVGVLDHCDLTATKTQAAAPKKRLPVSAQKIMAAFAQLRDGGRARVSINELRNLTFDLGFGGVRPDANASDGIGPEWNTYRKSRNTAFSRGLQILEEAGCLLVDNREVWEPTGNLSGILDD